MLAATATVIVATGQSPANIIILSMTVVSVSFVGLGTYRILAPLVSTVPDTGITIGGRTRIALEREKALVLRSLKELEFDFAMGKMAKADFDEMSGRLRARALGLMRQLDAGGGYKEQIAKEIAAAFGARSVRPTPDPRDCDRSDEACVRRLRHAERSRREVLQELRSEACEDCFSLSLFVICCSLFLCAAPASAQVEMPDPSAIAGTPLPAPELADRHRHGSRRQGADGQQRCRSGCDADDRSGQAHAQDRRAGPRAILRAQRRATPCKRRPSSTVRPSRRRSSRCPATAAFASP